MLDPEPKKPRGGPGPSRTLGSTVAGKVVLSIVGSILATMIIQSATMMALFRALCALIGLAGDPKVHDAVGKMLHQGQTTAAKVEARVDAAPAAPAPTAQPSLKEKLAEKVAEPVKEKVSVVKTEAAVQAVEAKVEAREKVEEVKNTITSVGARIGAGARVVGSKAAEVGHNAAAGTGELRQDMAEAQAQARVAAAHAAACPRCHVKLNLPPSASKMRTCLSCGTPSMPAQARQAARGGRLGR